jgi:rhodanese-related sulfurtransferase
MASEANAVTSHNEIPEISREELMRRLKSPSFKVIDVLPRESYASRHISGAISLPLDEIAHRARGLLPDLNAEIAVYCASQTCQRAEQAFMVLREMGYTNVRDYRAGLADWVEAGGPVEAVAPTSSTPEPLTEPPDGPPLADGTTGRTQARLSSGERWSHSLSDLIDQASTFQLFLVWAATVMSCGFTYWFGALIGDHGLVEAGAPVAADWHGFGTALYFSLVTATSVGYGDVVPIGIGRLIAAMEAVAALLIFGAVISKFVSHRQEDLVSEIHNITFEDRLDRVQANLHMVISELLAVAAACEAPNASFHRVQARLDSTLLVFLGELRTIHGLLYQPRLIVEEGVLASILASLASAMEILYELLSSFSADLTRSQPFEIAIGSIARLAEDVCSSCVPHSYTPRLIFWMDRIHATARRIH